MISDSTSDISLVMQDDEHSAPEAEKLQGKGGGGEDFENDLEANASAFEALERDFQDVRDKRAHLLCSV